MVQRNGCYIGGRWVYQTMKSQLSSAFPIAPRLGRIKIWPRKFMRILSGFVRICASLKPYALLRKNARLRRQRLILYNQISHGCTIAVFIRPATISIRAIRQHWRLRFSLALQRLKSLCWIYRLNKRRPSECSDGLFDFTKLTKPIQYPKP